MKSRVAMLSGFGQPPFDPRMVVALLLHGMLTRQKSPLQGWKTFLHNHGDGFVAKNLPSL